VIYGAAHKLPVRASIAYSFVLHSVRDSPKKPHAAPPAGILSVCQIKENRVANDLLIIVNDLVTLAH
jgi:hypothetical protein